MELNIFKKNNIGLAIGSGGALGYSAIPIIEELNKLEVKINLVSGSSIGSIIGAYYCLNGEVTSFFEKLNSFSKKDWLKLIDLNNPKKSLIKGKKIKKFLEENFFKNKTFEDLKIPLIIIGTNLTKKDVKYFCKGPLIDAIMASISIPGIFPPYNINDEYFIDGGVKENLPYEILFKKNINKVIGIDFNSINPNSKINYNSSFEILLNTFYLLLQTTKIEKKYENEIFLFKPKTDKNIGDSIKFNKIKNNYKAGKLEFNKNKKEFLKWIK